MEIKDIIALINTVSDSNLSSFTYEEGNVKLSFNVQQENKYIQTTKDFQDFPQIRKSDVTKELSQVIKGEIITSPMVGTFYSASSEGAKNFVSVGDEVKKGQTIGIVEAMKLINEIESPYDGIVEEIYVKNKDMIGFGQELMRIV